MPHPDIQTHHSKRLKILKNLTLLLVSVFLCVFIITNRDDFLILLSLDIPDLLKLCALNFLFLVILSLRFFVTLLPLSNRITFLDCFHYFVAGRFLGSFIPQGANIYKSVSLKLRNEINYKKYIAGIFIFYWFNLAFSFFIGTLIMALWAPGLKIGRINVCYLFLALTLMCIISLPVLRGIQQLGFLNRDWYIFKQVRYTIQEGRALMRNKNLIIANVLLVFADTLVGIGILYLCFRSMSIESTLPKLTLYLVLMRLANVVAITPGNIGVREFLFGYLTKTTGITMAAGISASIILRVVAFFVEGSISLGWVIYDRFSAQKNRGHSYKNSL